jgi:hypothetical protein
MSCVFVPKKRNKTNKQNEKIFLEDEITSAKKNTYTQKNHLLHNFFALYVTLIVVLFWC